MFSISKGYFKAQVVPVLIGILAIVIVVIGVCLPVIQDAIDTSGITGIPLVIVGFLSVLVAVAVLMVIASVTSG